MVMKAFQNRRSYPQLFQKRPGMPGILCTDDPGLLKNPDRPKSYILHISDGCRNNIKGGLELFHANLLAEYPERLIIRIKAYHKSV